MGAIVQRICVRWTKASRGAPAASRRNAVPEGFALPADASQDVALLVHQVRADEANGFCPTDQVSERDHVAAAEFSLDVRLTVADGALRVVRLQTGGPELAYPRRLARPRAAFTLLPGAWGRLRANARHAPGWDGDWWYDKVVINVAWQIDVARASRLFVEASPTAALDELVSLR